jgi:hypothetical protein
VRFLFGFTGASLIDGAVSSSCTRCTAPAIESRLAGLGSMLDVDGDGELEGLTDGVLLIRWMFEFTGATLVEGAVDLNDCTRCSAAQIESYLAGLP